MSGSERIGRYELLHRISAGGMGEVFFARLIGVEEFQKPLVVKRMLPEFSARKDVVTMFLDEARLVSKLDHPGIVQVFELGEENGQYFLAMELVDGPDLSRLASFAIKDGRPIPLPVAVWIVARAAEALHYAHEQKDPVSEEPLELVHRDISPQNILISKHGEVKIADFGIARAKQRDSQTEPGATKGKVAYMAPEQCFGEAVDRRTDVFALGIVLHELLARRPLYAGEGGMQAMQRILLEPAPPPSAANPRVDAALDAIVLRALEKAPGARYPTALDLVEALDDWLRANARDEPRTSLAAWVKAHSSELGPLAGQSRSKLLDGGPITLVSAPAEATYVPPKTLLHNLRAESSSFIGRAEPLAELQGMLEAGARLVTITGPGGTGKTRLGREFGRRHIAAGLGELWFVDLTRAEDLDDFLAATASSLSIVLGPSQSTAQNADEIGEWLARRGPVLLVLDNFEQIVDSSAEVLTRWLSRAPEARFLVSSREVLRLEGEHVLALGPLSVPQGAQDALGAEAVQLFLERAKAVRPNLQLSPAELTVVGKIARLLEGIPLAIELAAARIAVMGPAQLLERLSKSLDLLSSGRRDASPRQATLRGAMEWSWRLLTPVEQSALPQISVFRGGFALSEAEQVLALPSGPSGTPLVIDVLQALADKSLLRAEAQPSGDVRYGMYETVREFAAEKLGPEAEPVGDRHAETYVTLGEALAKRIDQRGGAEHFQRLVSDRDNLLAVFRRSIGEPSRIAQAARAAVALDAIVLRQGPVAMSLELHGALVDAEGFVALTSSEPELALEVLSARSRAAMLSSNLGAARADLERALSIARACGIKAGQARALADLGSVQRLEGEVAGAKQSYLQAATVLGSTPEPHLQGILWLRLANIDADLGNLEEAADFYARALQAFRKVGDLRYEAICLSNMAFLDAEVLSFDRGLERARRSITMQREVGDRVFEATAVMVAGLLAWYADDPEEALRRLGHAAKTLRDLGARRYECLIDGLLGAFEALSGDIESGEARILAAEKALFAMGDRLSLTQARVHHGYLELARAHRHLERGELPQAMAERQALEARIQGIQEATKARPLAVQSARLALRDLVNRAEQLKGRL